MVTCLETFGLFPDSGCTLDIPAGMLVAIAIEGQGLAGLPGGEKTFMYLSWGANVVCKSVDGAMAFLQACLCHVIMIIFHLEGPDFESSLEQILGLTFDS